MVLGGGGYRRISLNTINSTIESLSRGQKILQAIFLVAGSLAVPLRVDVTNPQKKGHERTQATVGGSPFGHFISVDRGHSRE